MGQEERRSASPPVLSDRDVSALSDAFAAVLREWLTPTEWEEMQRRNAEPPYADAGCCASHDFCDANMAMAAAFRRAFGRSPRIYHLPSGEEGRDVPLWNAAWADAAARHLTNRRG